MPTAIFSFTMRFLTLIGLTIPSLRLTMIFSFPGQPAWIAAISLSPEASPADTENQSAPPAANLDQQQNGHTSGLENNRKTK